MNEPSDWVVRWAHLIPPGGRVLDLACGHGRHARYLASRGHAVLACDRDLHALVSLADVPGVETVQLDLENGAPWPFPGRQFEAVVVVNFAALCVNATTGTEAPDSTIRAAADERRRKRMGTGLRMRRS